MTWLIFHELDQLSFFSRQNLLHSFVLCHVMLMLLFCSLNRIGFFSFTFSIWFEWSLVNNFILCEVSMFWLFILDNWWLLLVAVAGLFTFNFGLIYEKIRRTCFSLILMPRICCTLQEEGSCDSGQPESEFKGFIFTFPYDKNEKRQCQR